MRAQIIIEFLTLIGVGLLLVAVVTSVVIDASGDRSQQRHEASVQEQYERLRSEFLAATIALDGYRTRIAFEPPYRGVAMNLTIRDGGIVIRSARASAGGTIPGIVGDIDTSSATLTVERVDGEVRVT